MRAGSTLILAVAVLAGCGDDDGGGDEAARAESTDCLATPDAPECSLVCRAAIGAYEDSTPATGARLVGCRSNADCPGGTRCEDAPGCRPVLRPALRECVGTTEPGDVRQACGIHTSSFARPPALIGGFDTAAMPMRRVAEPGRTTALFVAEAPEPALAITCALFVCVPEFELVELHGFEVHRIANFGRCVAAYATFVGRRADFDLSQVQPQRGHELPVTTLHAGCWAIDETRVVAATELHEVGLAEANRPDILAATCTETDDWKTCPISDPAMPESAYEPGTCFGGVCRQRCVDDADCLRPLPGEIRDAGVPHDGGVAVDGGLAPDEDRSTCRFERDTSYVGACVPGGTPEYGCDGGAR